VTENNVKLLITAVDQTRTAIDSVKRRLSGLAEVASRVNSAIAGIGVAVAAASISKFVKSSIDAADALYKMSQRVGVSVEKLSLLIPIAEQSGISSGSLEISLRRLSDAMFSAATGAKDARQLFRALGVEVKNQDGTLRATDQVLIDLAERFKAMPDGAQKSALALQIFGRAGTDIIPFLNQGRDGIAALTEELQALGVQIGTDTSAHAEEFNDALHKIKLIVKSVGNQIAEAFLPLLSQLAQRIVDSAKQGGVLRSVLDGIRFVINGVAAALKSVALVAFAATKAFAVFSETIGALFAARTQALKLNFEGVKAIFAELRANIKRQVKEISEFYDSIFNPKPAKGKQPAVQVDDELLSRLNNEKASKTLAFEKQRVSAELSIIKDGLQRQKAELDAALEDRLISIREYYARKTDIEQREIDAEIARAQALLSEQRRLAAQSADDAERLRAKGEVARLEAELIVLNNRRAAVEQANARAAAKAERELADALEDARLKLAEITGSATDADRRTAVERSYRDLRARLEAQGDAAGVAIIDKLINVEAAQRNLQALEDQWQRALENMRNIEQSVNIQQAQGLITTSEAQEKIAAAHNEAAAALDELLPKMEAAAQAIGPEAVTRVQAWKNELASVKDVVDPIAASIDTAAKDAFVSMFESISTGAKSAKEAFADFARSVLSAIQRILAQRFAEQLFGFIGGGGSGSGGGIGKFFSKILKFASGGSVPGSGTSDTVPAMLTPGEYVIRREAVRRFGIGLLDAINGLRLPPGIARGRLAFASGGLVPQVGGVVNNVSVIVNAEGGSVQGDTQAAADLGRRIEAAVRGVLISEKRPGGLLSVV
jgi:lambda family phage tail tape measure protein